MTPAKQGRILTRPENRPTPPISGDRPDKFEDSLTYQWNQTHCCPTYPLSLRERVGERGCSFCIVVTGIYVHT